MANRMIGRFRRWPTLLVCGLGLVLPERAHAEAGAAQKAAAEALFDDALKAMQGGHFAEACPQLEESERIDPGIGTLLYLGECYEKTGRTASAWATFREAASTAQAQGETERSRVAVARADRLQTTLSKLTLSVAPETAALASLRVTRDGAALASTLFGVAIPIDPGKYHVVASADGYQSFETDVEVAAHADSKALQIPALKAATASTVAAVSASPTTTGPASSGPISATSQPATSAPAAGHARLRTAAYVTGALGIVSLGIGSYFGVKAISKNSDAESHCPRGNLCDDVQGEQLTKDAKSAAVVSNVTMGIGAAFAVAGIVLYLTSEPSEQAARLELHPLLSRQGSGLGLGGAF